MSRDLPGYRYMICPLCARWRAGGNGPQIVLLFRCCGLAVIGDGSRWAVYLPHHSSAEPTFAIEAETLDEARREIQKAFMLA